MAKSNMIIPESYSSSLDLRETEKAIKFIKGNFQDRLAEELNLERVSAPILVLRKTGINDYLTGKEKPIRFNVSDMNEEAEIVQSLAKWKRAALADYGFDYGEGLYTDMNAIRPDEILDNLHSVYVDQWDWEKVIRKDERNLDFLKLIVRKIYRVIKEMEELVCEKFEKVKGPFLPDEINFIHSEDLLEMYPDLSPEEREDEICREKEAVFVMGIGAKLKDGRSHDERAADYDDWSTETKSGRKGLNGDILVWYPLLQCALELSSMGIRVDKNSLLKQLEIKGEQDNVGLYFHQRLLQEELPLTIGGGIGQSRLCMLFLRKVHIGEVQSSIWPDEMAKICKRSKIFLL
ncbi:MAG: aspartate--ammonia ligase [Candidatus Hydrogenedentota bacterium]|nr:MAG: aspartate--ammonia ligase [Candidatus Hydrogenedentota bacterium]